MKPHGKCMLQTSLVQNLYRLSLRGVKETLSTGVTPLLALIFSFFLKQFFYFI